MLLKEAVQLGIRELSMLDERDAQAKLRRLFSHILGREYKTLPLLGDYPLSEVDLDRFYKALSRLKTYEPIEYILGEAWFYGYPLTVSPATLIPRPETEELVERILQDIEGVRTVVDCGTGSGAIAISIASEVENSRFHGERRLGTTLEAVFAVDVSQEALDVCTQNIEDLAMSDLVTPLHMDATTDTFGSFLEKQAGPIIVVANFPYIPTSDMITLDSTVADFEPQLALDGGPDGTSLILPLLTQCEHYVDQIKRIYLEIDPANIPSLESYLKTSPFTARFEKDIAGTIRFVRVSPK